MQIIVAKFGEGGVGVVERSLSLRRDLSPMHQANNFLVVVTPQTTAGLPASHLHLACLLSCSLTAASAGFALSPFPPKPPLGDQSPACAPGRRPHASMARNRRAGRIILPTSGKLRLWRRGGSTRGQASRDP